MATRKKTRRPARRRAPRTIDLRRSRDRSHSGFNIEAALRAMTGEQAPTLPAPAAADGPSRSLRIPLDPGETPDGMRAKTVLRPTMRAAQVMAAFDQSVGELDLTTLVAKLAQQVAAVQGGDLSRAEEMLIAQAHTLDMVFNQLLHRSVQNIRGGYVDAGETFMRLALRTQSQCRSTLETLSVVKNPPAVAFVRQANIANGPQQVNNGTAHPEPLPSRAGETAPSKLLEQQHGERLDFGAPQATVRGDPAMATVGKINGTAHR